MLISFNQSSSSRSSAQLTRPPCRAEAVIALREGCDPQCATIIKLTKTGCGPAFFSDDHRLLSSFSDHPFDRLLTDFAVSRISKHNVLLCQMVPQQTQRKVVEPFRLKAL